MSVSVVSGKEVLSVSEGWVIVNESGGDVVSVVSLETESTFVVSLKIVSVITLVVSEISDFSNPAPLKSFFASKNCLLNRILSFKSKTPANEVTETEP